MQSYFDPKKVLHKTKACQVLSLRQTEDAASFWQDESTAEKEHLLLKILKIEETQRWYPIKKWKIGGLHKRLFGECRKQSGVLDTLENFILLT